MTSTEIEVFLHDLDKEAGPIQVSATSEYIAARGAWECALQLAIANENATLANVRTDNGALVVTVE